MSDVPEGPEAFFTDYLPRRFEPVKAMVAGKSSVGCMTFRVSGVGEWSLRLTNGELSVAPGMADDVIVQVTITQGDFGPILVQGAREHETLAPDPKKQIMAFKALSLDASQADLVRSVKGTVAFVVKDGDRAHQLAITPGDAVPSVEAPDCKLECLMSDFMDMQAGKVVPVQLAMSGKIKIIGNAQIPMALSAVFA